jgi:effector-binding domain-containing protein
MARDASIIQVRPLLLAAVRRQVTKATLANAVISAPVWALLSERGVPNTGRTVVIYWNDDARSLEAPLGVPIDIGVEVEDPIDHPALSVVQTPAGRAASFHHIGPYRALEEVHSDIRAWCAARGERLAGVSWEVFDYFDEDQSKCETGVFYLLA